MRPVAVYKAYTSLKYELCIAAAVLLALAILPTFSLFSIINIASLTTHSLYDAPSYIGDNYAFGNCTYWVFMLRSQAHQPIPNGWGNAINWAKAASQAGFTVDHIPAVGSIMQDSNAPGGEGHVAYVTSVSAADGSWTISEMNRIGYDEVDNRTLPSTEDTKYNFIH